MSGLYGCGSYCDHGGICELPRGHEGLHDSGYCQWDDEHALTEAEADALLTKTAGGRGYLAMKYALQPLFGDEPL